MLNTFNIYYYDSVNSTNDEAKRIVYDHEEEGIVVCAKEQTQGRGRMGRRWISKPGNLYFTLILKQNGHLSSLAQLSFVAAVAVGQAIASFIPAEKKITYKWPNDVLVNSQKIAGILLETEPSLTDLNITYILMGIGVNINFYPDHIIYPATCVNENTKTPISCEVFLKDCLENIKFLYNKWQTDGFLPIRTLWLNQAHMIGHEITASLNGQLYKGDFKGIDTKGALVLGTPSGEKIISSAEIIFN